MGVRTPLQMVAWDSIPWDMQRSLMKLGYTKSVWFGTRPTMPASLAPPTPSAFKCYAPDTWAIARSDPAHGCLASWKTCFENVNGAAQFLPCLVKLHGYDAATCWRKGPASFANALDNPSNRCYPRWSGCWAAPAAAASDDPTRRRLLSSASPSRPAGRRLLQPGGDPPPPPPKASEAQFSACVAALKPDVDKCWAFSSWAEAAASPGKECAANWKSCFESAVASDSGGGRRLLQDEAAATAGSRFRTCVVALYPPDKATCWKHPGPFAAALADPLNRCAAAWGPCFSSSEVTTDTEFDTCVAALSSGGGGGGR